MLSTKPIGNVDGAKHYFFGHDNYYTQDDALALARSEWCGKGAQSLKLEGNVDSNLFKQLLKGQLPDGQQLGLKVNGEIKHRAGFDLTFSAPKSVSILALLGGDERILSAVQRATDKTLDMIERACAQARVTRDDVTTYENTKNLVVAKFLHDISREADPQLHVHCVVMNMTQRSDSKWRSLASQPGDYGADAPGEVNGFFERVRHHKHHYGSIFRAELAYEMKQLGYEIVKTGKHSLFEIAGISQKAIDIYSQRAKQIMAYMKEYGFSGAKAAAVATIKTRQAKNNINRENLAELWKARSQTNNIDAYQEAKMAVEQALNQGKNLSQDNDLNFKVAKEAVQYAIDHLSETQIAIKEIQLINIAVQQAIGENVAVSQLLQAIKLFQQGGELIAIDTKTDETHFTTRKLLEFEKDILQAICKKPDNAKAMVSKEGINAYLSQQNHLNLEQKQAVKTIFSSEYRINMLAGQTGSGKTYLIKPMMELARLNGYRSILLTLSSAASVDLKQQLHATSKTIREWIKRLFDNNEYDTISHFIKTQEKLINTGQISKKKSIIFVDNATLLSSKQMRDLILIAEKLDQRLVPIGDKKTVLSWQAGSPFLQMIEKGAVCAELNQNHRIQEAKIKLAIENTLQSNIASAFEKIGHRIIAIENKEQRLEAMAAQYVSLDQAERQRTLVLTPTKAQCEEMNGIIREKLKRNYQIDNESIQTTVLLPKSFSEAQYQYARNYTVGHWVRFNEHFKSLNVQWGEYLKIQAIQSSDNRVILKNFKGENIAWDLSKIVGKSGRIEVFEEKVRELIVGDTLLWKRGNKQRDIYSGERFKIEFIKNNQITLLRDNQKRIKLDLKDIESHHFDYGYASTPLQKHYAVTSNIIAYQSSFSNQSHQRLFYKELSQAQQNVWIYTENKEALLKNIKKHTGDKLTVINSLINDTELSQKHEGVPHSDYLHLLEKSIARVLRNSKEDVTLTKAPELLAKEAVQYALAHLTEREAAFLHKQVLEVALEHVLGHVDSKIIQTAIKEAEEKGEIIRGVYSQDGTRWTTPEAIVLEQSILQIAQQDKGKLNPIIENMFVDKYLQTILPKEEHAQAIRAICSNSDRHLLIQGLAGTGKTTLLMHIQPLLKEQSYELLCLAPTHVAVKELKERGLTAQTLDSFLVQNKQPTEGINYPGKLILALDENSMTSNRRMLAFLEMAQLKETRTIFIGDKAQHPAIESGKPHILLENRIKTIYLKDIERQKEQNLRKAVHESYQKDFIAAFQTLENRIIEMSKTVIDGKTIDLREHRLEAICQDYLSRSREDRAKTLIITLGNEDRNLLNVLIREGLKSEGELYGKAVEVSVLVSRDMTEIEKTRVTNYCHGDYVRFNYSHKKLGIEKGDYLAISDIHTQKNCLVLRNKEGKTMVWQPPKLSNDHSLGVEVYAVENRELMAGDLIRWTRSDKTLGLLSPELAQVKSIEKDRISLKPAKMTKESMVIDNEVITIQPQEAKYQHWDHAYAMTGYSSQSKTVSEAIINLESYRKNLSNQPAWIVALTRAQYKVTIYTDDKKALLKQIIKNKGEKTSALETVGEWKNSHNTLSSISSFKDFFAEKENVKQLEFSLKGAKKIKKEAPNLKKSISFDAQKITRLLSENAETVVEKLLGEPKERSSNQFRYGSKHGSLIVTLQGEKRGLWHDFQTGEGGNLLHLIAKQSGLELKSDFRKVLAQTVQLLGTQESLVSQQTVSNTTINKSYKEDFIKPKTLSEIQKRSLSYARKLARESKAIEGTLAERYLREHRGIQLEKLPSSFRFHSAIYSKQNEMIKPALLVVAKDNENKVQAVQAIFLDERTANKATVKVQKQTWGLPSSGVSVDLSSSNNFGAPVYLAEGPETGLSVFEAMPQSHIKITLGKSNFKNIDPEKTGKNIVLCLDNDGNNPNTEKLIHFAAKRLIEKGKEVWIAKPEEVKKDYNDLLKEQGVEAVKTNIEKAIPYHDFANQSASPITLKSAVLDNLNPLKNAAKEALENKIHNLNLDSLNNQKTPNIAKMLDNFSVEKAKDLLKTMSSFSQKDVDKYLGSGTDQSQKRVKEIPDSSRKFKQTTIEKNKEKEPEL